MTDNSKRRTHTMSDDFLLFANLRFAISLQFSSLCDVNEKGANR